MRGQGSGEQAADAAQRIEERLGLVRYLGNLGPDGVAPRPQPVGQGRVKQPAGKVGRAAAKARPHVTDPLGADARPGATSATASLASCTPAAVKR